LADLLNKKPKTVTWGEIQAARMALVVVMSLKAAIALRTVRGGAQYFFAALFANVDSRETVPRLSRVNFVRYADDFIITGKSRQILENQFKPAVEAFLAERGLTLSPEKTMITYIKDRFNFLGKTFRKHGNTLHITPAKEGVLALIQKVGELIRTHVSAPMPTLIKKLNQTPRGWGNYHRYVVASEAFSRMDTYVYEELWRMIRCRHSNKSERWLAKKYWLASGRRRVFSATSETRKGKRLYEVVRLSSLGIRRYLKVKADANPYQQEYAAYFWRRRHDKEARLLSAMSSWEYRSCSQTMEYCYDHTRSIPC
jgi:RNA-directed DNA polymerase